MIAISQQTVITALLVAAGAQEDLRPIFSAYGLVLLIWTAFRTRSEEELDRELHDAAALLIGHGSKVRRIQLSGGRVEAES